MSACAYKDTSLPHGEIHLTSNRPFPILSYAFLVHGKGPATEDFGDVFIENNATVTSSNVVIEGNTIENIKCWVNEVPAVVEDSKVVTDARAAVFQFVKTVDQSLISINDDGTYKRNVVADMQLMVANAILDGVLVDTPEQQTGVNTIGRNLIDWASDASTTYSPLFRCNGDSMHHVGKGIVVIRIDDTKGFTIRRNKISGIENLSVAPFTNCHDFHEMASFENQLSQQGGNVRAISVAAGRGYAQGQASRIEHNQVENLKSINAKLIAGVDIQGDTANTIVENNSVDLQTGVGVDPDDAYVACRIRQYVQKSVSVSNNNLKQDEQILNTGEGHVEPPERGHHGCPIEWSTSGCPFARR